MEASDAFAKGVEESEGDPFAGTDFGDFGDTPSGELKTVDKEGNAVNGGEPTQEDPQPADPTSGEPAASAGPTEATEAEAAAKAAAEPPEAPQEPQGDPTPASSGEPVPSGAVAASGDAVDPPPTGDSPSSSTTGSPQESPSSETATATSSESSSRDEPEDAPAPVEERGAGGKTSKRRYFVLQVEGPGKFRQVEWYVDGKGKMVPRGTQGAKRQTIALANGAEAALKIAYAALGSPEAGVTLVAVAALHFQPRNIKPMPPEPSRQRLHIT